MALIDDFKARFPEFDTAVVDEYLPILEDVWPCYFGGSYTESCNKEIILNLIAHLLVDETNSGSGNVKSTQSRSVGDVSVTFSSGSYQGGQSFDYFRTTKYGRRYWMLVSRATGPRFA